MTKSIKELTSRPAVESEIAEFNDLGRDALFAKYGCKHALGGGWSTKRHMHLFTYSIKRAARRRCPTRIAF